MSSPGPDRLIRLTQEIENLRVVKTCRTCGRKYVCLETERCSALNSSECNHNCSVCRNYTDNCKIKMVGEKTRRGNPKFIGGKMKPQY